VEPDEAVITRQWPSKHAYATTDMHTTEELQEGVFSMWSVLRLYNENHRRISQQSAEGSQSCQTVKYDHESCGTRQARASSNLAVCQRLAVSTYKVVSEQSQLVVGYEHRSRGISIVGSCYQAMTSEDITE
jgi:hypothetical protein